MNDLLLRDGVVVRASNKNFFGFYSTIIYLLLRDGVVRDEIIATFRLQYEDDYEYEFSVLSTRCRFKGRNFSKCACSELKTRTRSRPRTPI